MKILMCGSRDWTRRAPIRMVLERYDPKSDVIIEGGARGADEIARDLAHYLGFDVVTVPADWEGLGYSAGPERNRQMLEMRPDRVHAFSTKHPLTLSKGTNHMVSISKDAGIAGSITYDYSNNSLTGSIYYQ